MTSARDKIVDTALELLAERGAASFTYESLAKTAGVSRQTLYTHFPTRADLLVGVADRARAELDVDGLSVPVYEAATAMEALHAVVDLHVAFTPRVLHGMRAVELERAADPLTEKAFDQRAAGRISIIRHVVNRLRAEGLLEPTWSIEAATDFTVATTSATYTYELLEVRGWSVEQLRDRLLHVLVRSLVSDPDTSSPSTTSRKRKA